jgi:hypothetical protein
MVLAEGLMKRFIIGEDRSQTTLFPNRLGHKRTQAVAQQQPQLWHIAMPPVFVPSSASITKKF